MIEARVSHNRIIIKEDESPTGKWITYATFRDNKEAEYAMALFDGRVLKNTGY